MVRSSCYSNHPTCAHISELVDAMPYDSSPVTLARAISLKKHHGSTKCPTYIQMHNKSVQSFISVTLVKVALVFLTGESTSSSPRTSFDSRLTGSECDLKLWNNCFDGLLQLGYKNSCLTIHFEHLVYYYWASIYKAVLNKILIEVSVFNQFVCVLWQQNILQTLVPNCPGFSCTNQHSFLELLYLYMVFINRAVSVYNINENNSIREAVSHCHDFIKYSISRSQTRQEKALTNS